MIAFGAEDAVEFFHFSGNDIGIRALDAGEQIGERNFDNRFNHGVRCN